MTGFLVVAKEAMSLRDEEGVRGFARERSRLRCHIEPAPMFAGKEVEDLGARDVRDWLRWMQQRDAADKRAARKISRETIQRSQALLSAIFAYAVEREIIASNPCVGVRLKRRADESATRVKWAYLTIDEQRALVACTSVPEWDRLAMRFAIGTGLRQAEQFNLELADVIVDGDDPHVVVRFSTPLKGKKTPPKSGKVRKVELFLDGLASARESLAFVDGRPNVHGLLFPSQRGMRRHPGKPLGTQKLTTQHYAAAGIKLRPYLVWHSLRHTFGTNLASGVLGRYWRPLEIQRLMGHASLSMTERYVHISDETIRIAAREAEELALAKAPPAAPVSPGLKKAPPDRESWRDVAVQALDKVKSWLA